MKPRLGMTPVVFLAVILAACGAGAASGTAVSPAPGHARARSNGHARGVDALVAVGQPQPSRRVEVMGIAGTLELAVSDPAAPSSPSVLVTLGRPVRREPRDMCFGSYLANQSPEDGDVYCQVRGRDPLILTLSTQAVLYSSRVLRFTTLWGQVDPHVVGLELIGPDGSRTLPLSADRLFLVAFSPSERGAFRLVLRRRDGARFNHSFILPLTRLDAGAWPRLGRRGAVFSDAPIGENVVTMSYREIVRKLGPPLRGFSRAGGVRCIYYDIVGYTSGWVFCFKGQGVVGAAANQAPPRG
jgi:hypothetical protein